MLKSPGALELPPGRGAPLRDDMRQLVDTLRSAIPSAFETDSYRARKHGIDHEIKDQQEKAFEEIQQEASTKNVLLLRTPTGLILAPALNGEVITREDFEKLPEAEHQQIDKTISEPQEKLQAVLRQVPKWQQEAREKLRALNDEVAAFAVGHLIDDLRKKYVDLPEVVRFLNQVQADLIENVDEFLRPAENPLPDMMGMFLPRGPKGSAFFRRYQVNVLVDHSGDHGAPVVYEDHPTYQNLVGAIEYIAQMGALATDFDLIRPGALHRANGGYLIFDLQTAGSAVCLGGLKTVLARIPNPYRITRSDDGAR